jgi:hypothetical protein
VLFFEKRRKEMCAKLRTPCSQFRSHPVFPKNGPNFAKKKWKRNFCEGKKKRISEPNGPKKSDWSQINDSRTCPVRNHI